MATKKTPASPSGRYTGELAAATTDEARAEVKRRIALVRKAQAAVQLQIDKRTSRLTPP